MSASKEQIVREIYETWHNVDYAGGRRLFAENIVLDLTRRLIDPFVIEGREPVLRALTEVRDPWDESRIEIEELIEHGDDVVAFVHVSARGKASGATSDTHVAHMWTIRDGQAQQFVYFGDREEALRYIGIER